jgi:Fe2+ transport system protein FeoA
MRHPRGETASRRNQPAAAEERAEKIRNLRRWVPAWIEGRISDEELNRLPVAAQTRVMESSAVAEVPRRRLLRLGFAVLLVLVLGGAVWLRRLREMGLMPHS